MIFEKVFEELTQYPFVEKMLICQEHATKLMKLCYLDILNREDNMVYPWELETFAELSLLAEGTEPTKSFNLSGYRAFSEIINSIRNYMHPHLEHKKGTAEFAHDFIMVTGMIQFKVQENILNRIYRYKYFFDFQNNNLDMRSEFYSSFDGLYYEDFVELAVLIYFFASFKANTSDIIKFIAQRRLDVVQKLKISRHDYIEKQQEKNKYDLENSFYGFNYLFPYPFIEYMGFIFLPLPYLVVDAITDSLLTRMTFGKDRLREAIGKEVAQQYIIDIMKQSNIYDEVLPEQSYMKGKDKIDTPDIMIKQENLYCLIDSKLSTPKLSLRQFEQIDVDKTIQQYAKNIKQIFERINEFGTCYYPFKNIRTIEKQNIFGLIVLFEESYISKEKIYKKACDMIGVDFYSSQGRFVVSNIKLIDLHGLELFSFSSYSIFPSLIEKRDNMQLLYDIGIYNHSLYKDIKPKKPKNLKIFERNIHEIYEYEIHDLVEAGLVDKRKPQGLQ